MRIFLGELGDLLRNTKFNAETAEAAEKKPSKALRSLRALRSKIVISFNGVCPASLMTTRWLVVGEPTLWQDVHGRAESVNVADGTR